MAEDHLVDAAAAAAVVADVTHRPCTPATIRQWATRQHIHRHGYQDRRTLYSLREIYQHLGVPDPYTTPLTSDLAADAAECHTSLQ